MRFRLNPVIIFLIGCGMTAVLTISSYKTNVSDLRNKERKIVTEITTQLQINLQITVGESILPLLFGSQSGEISPELFTKFTDPILNLASSVTSIGWVPRVEPQDRDSFTAKNSEVYNNFTISVIGVGGEVAPRPIDNRTIWPLLHANPIIQDGFRGVDLYAGLWKDAIDLMVSENRTIISDLVDLVKPSQLTYGVFTNQRSVYQLFQPVFDIHTYKLIGIFNRLFFPSILVRSSIDTTSLDDIDKYQISITRINENGNTEDVYIATNTGSLLSSGKNTYRDESEINNTIFITELVTGTVPKFKTYGVILIVSFFACIVVSRMYIVQMNASKRDKDMSVKYKKATDMKSTFLAEMSHELRTPLNGIIGTIDILTSINIPPEVREYLQDIKSCGNILITLITGILDFSKIEAGKIDLDISPINIPSIVHDTIKVMVQSFNSRKNVEVILNTVSVPIDTRGDEVRIRQIFMNMLSNAFKFTDTGKVTVDISSTEITTIPSGTYIDDVSDKAFKISISVTDTGIGISEDRIDDLFQPFSQIKGKSSVGGTGLGLMITKTLCESMGGSVSCSSVYTKGSCFSCEMIVGSSQEEREASTCHRWSLGDIVSPETDIEQGRYINENNANVLIVDDVLINLKVAEKLFALNGITCDTASDGVQAIELCGTNKYKLILMDYYMPGMSGVDVAIAIRGEVSNANKDSTIICLTASHTKETIDSIMESGMTGYELKPIRADMINSLCRRYMDIGETKDESRD